MEDASKKLEKTIGLICSEMSKACTANKSQTKQIPGEIRAKKFVELVVPGYKKYNKWLKEELKAIGITPRKRWDEEAILRSKAMRLSYQRICRESAAKY